MTKSAAARLRQNDTQRVLAALSAEGVVVAVHGRFGVSVNTIYKAVCAHLQLPSSGRSTSDQWRLIRRWLEGRPGKVVQVPTTLPPLREYAFSREMRAAIARCEDRV